MNDTLGGADISELTEAGVALRDRRWAEAYAVLKAADTTGTLDGDSLRNLAEAAFWLGNLDEVVTTVERAYRAYLGVGNRSGAAQAAMQLSLEYEGKAAPALASGWLSRAATILKEEPPCGAHGWLALLQSRRARFSGDRGGAWDLSQEAAAVADQFDDRDLWAQATQSLGWIKLQSGELDEGWALIDEAAAAAMGGELGTDTTARIFCRVISACREVMDVARASQWTDAARHWCDRESVTGFPGVCRVHRAELLRLQGEWIDCESEALRATEELPSFSPADAALAFVALAEIKMRKGELELAGEAVANACHLGESGEPVFSLLQLYRGDSGAAVSSIQRALDNPALSRPERARMLYPAVEIFAAGNLTSRAEEACAELERIADEFGADVFRAMAAESRGRILLAKGLPAEALRSLDSALSRWRTVDAPFESARTRALMGDAHVALGESAMATRELRTAHDIFQRLGARRDQSLARDALDLLNAPSRATIQRTFLFSDIVSSTPLVEAIGDSAWSEMVAWHDRTLRSIFVAHGGEEVDHAGDGFFVAFGDPDSAIRCAVEIQRQLAAHRRDHGFAPGVRIGVHGASSVQSGRSYKGKGVHVAARIGAQAGAGEILTSADTLTACRDHFNTIESRTLALKGIADSMPAVVIAWSVSSP